MRRTDTTDERIVIVAPVGRDSRMLAAAIEAAGFRADVCGSLKELTGEVASGAGVILVTEETLTNDDGRALLVETLTRQPAWSDMPVIVLTSSDRAAEPTAAVMQDFASLGNVTLLERPIRIMSLATTVRSALRARRRQYEVRDYVIERERLERQLRDWTEELEHANRAKDEFLAMLSHELRNPLGAIASASSVLDRAPAESRPATHAREVIARQIRHLVGVVDDLLDLGRVTTGKIMLHRRPVDMAAIVNRVVEHLAVAGRTGAHEVAVKTQPVWVDGDETRLEQIVSNLVTNALKYTPDGGSIRVDIRAENGDAVLRVADTGIGIPADRLPLIFDLFFQGERALDRRQGGLGIGLTLVKRLVGLHGGSVVAESHGIDRGSIFTVRLPCVSPGVAEPPTAEAPRGQRRVLVIEDNADSREMLRAALEIAGHVVAVAEDGPGGLAQVQALSPDAVILDIGLPGVDGYEVAQQLRRLPGAEHVLIIALSGYGREEDRRRSAESGFDAHLVKPVDPLVLERILAAPRGSPSDVTDP